MELYYASCAAGLESVALSEIVKLSETCVESTVPVFGGVLFRTGAQPKDVFKLRSVDNVYAFLGHFKDVPVEKERAVSYMKSVAKMVEWEPALKLFRNWQAMQERQLSSPLTFRVSCERKCLKMKKHPYSSMDAAAAIGESVQSLHSWPADMKCYNVEVIGWIIDTELLLVIGLVYSKVKEVEGGKLGRPSRSDAQLFSKRPYRKALVQTSLRPSVAYALLQLGHIKPGDIILDPMCGCGTIPLEAGECYRGDVMCIGGDISPTATAASGANVKATEPPTPCDIVQWNASFMPVRTGCVDWVICDMPFGVRCGTTQARDWLCQEVLEEFSRVLKPGVGVAILMSQGKAMKEVMMKTPYLKILEHRDADMEGILVEIYVAQRTSQLITTPTHRKIWKTNKKQRVTQ